MFSFIVSKIVYIYIYVHLYIYTYIYIYIYIHMYMQCIVVVCRCVLFSVWRSCVFACFIFVRFWIVRFLSFSSHPLVYVQFCYMSSVLFLFVVFIKQYILFVSLTVLVIFKLFLVTNCYLRCFSLLCLDVLVSLSFCVFLTLVFFFFVLLLLLFICCCFVCCCY